MSQSQSFVLSYLGPEAGQVRQLEIQQVESDKYFIVPFLLHSPSSILVFGSHGAHSPFHRFCFFSC